MQNKLCEEVLENEKNLKIISKLRNIRGGRMEILDSNTVVVFDSLDLKEVLEQDNSYNYIYFGDNITLEEDIGINELKENVVIDGTYLNNKYTYTVDSSVSNYKIQANSLNKKITVKNMKVISSSEYGIIYCPSSTEYSNVVIEYINITFNGVEMANNPYGSLRIIDCIVNIESTNGIDPQEVAEAAKIEIGGSTTIINTSVHYALFFYLSNISAPSFKVLPNSIVNLRSENNEFMRGTNRLDFKVLHDAEVNLITGNGFAASTIHGALNVFIDERVNFSFIETKHQRIPMWSIFGELTINEGANFLVLNTYESTPSDNYNLHFKGGKPKINLNNPESIAIYTKNANVLYTNNPLEFSFKTSRINMWINSTTFASAGGIYYLPDYSWYKEGELMEISGTIQKDSTSVTTHNFTEEEINKLPDLSNFVFQSRKQFSVGKTRLNIHPITSSSNSISGHTLAFGEVLIKYGDTLEIVSADEDGLFKYDLENVISNNTEIEIISCIAGSFVYTTRIITTPYEGEITLMSSTNNIIFSLSPISYNPVILPKTKSVDIKVVDSRVNSTTWNLYASIEKEPISENGFYLVNAVIFEKFDGDIISLSTTPVLIFTGTDTKEDVKVYDITWSVEKGPLLSLEKNALEINEEYNTKVIWNIEE